MTKLRSPYVINFIGAGHSLGKLCILTEYCNRGSISEVIFSKSKIRYGLLLRYTIPSQKKKRKKQIITLVFSLKKVGDRYGFFH